jgi:small subunit ribosomal protein S9
LAKVQYFGTGRRKKAVARVILTPGEGKILVNKREASNYFGNRSLLTIARMPLVVTNVEDKYDVIANIKGGGVSGQADALRHGIARALLNVNEKFKGVLKKSGLLTRDDRMHERKKYGLAGRRKRFQFSKR